jgi:hypothetical protein
MSRELDSCSRGVEPQERESRKTKQPDTISLHSWLGTRAIGPANGRRRGLLRFCAFAVLSSGVARSPRASAEPVPVKVIDISGEQIYIEPGEEAGLRLDTRVTIGGATYVVAELNAKTAALRPERGQRGAVALDTAGTAEVTAKRAPRSADAFREQWPPAVPPARTEKPATIPLGGEAGGGASRVTVIGHAFGAAGRAGEAASAEARIVATFDGLGGRPLGIDLDLAGRAYSQGWNGDERIPIMVRTGQVRWSRLVALGRLRHAATGLGMLDGGRVAVRAGKLELAAFGGLVPDPLSGEPDTDASRFGVELGFDDPLHDWQPRVAMTAYASTFDGELDERRLSVSGSAAHHRVWLDGWAEAQSFAADNPFGAASVELVGAGAGTSWRTREAHAGIGVTFLRPERSLRLAAALPPAWLCERDRTAMCVGGDRWIATTASAGLRRARWSLDAIVSLGQTTQLTDAEAATDVSGYLRGEVVAGEHVRIFGAPSAGRNAFSEWVAMELGAGIASDRVDAMLSYRPELLADGPFDRVTLHGLTGELRVAASPVVDLALVTLATLGEDRTMLAGLVTMVWRAR